MIRQQFLIQFMHPGNEPRPGEGTAWNRDVHRRKFLRSGGTILDNGTPRESQLLFWGEWEANSTAERIRNPLPDGPQRIFTPFYVSPMHYEGHQNTDPFVFGERFLYSNCQQLRPGPTKMQMLDRGSVILFGSHRNGGFLLDTVFVVASRIPFSAQRLHELNRQVPNAFLDVTAAPLFDDLGPPVDVSAVRERCSPTTGANFTLYFGATLEEPVNGMFSFVPTRIAVECERGFLRPMISAPFVSARLTQSFRDSELPADMIPDAWEDVCSQVLAHGCKLGVRFDVPPRRSESAHDEHINPAARPNANPCP